MKYNTLLPMRARRVLHAPAHRAGAGAVGERELLEMGVRRGVDQEVDIALLE